MNYGKLKILSTLMICGFASVAAADGRHGGRHGRDRDRHDRDRRDRDRRDHDDDDAELFSLGALLGSLAVSSTSAADEESKLALDRSDAIIEQILNRELSESFYAGFRSEAEFAKLRDFEIDLVLIQTLNGI